VTTRSPCDEIAADAVGLAALPVGASERTRAEAHAATCAACARSLADAHRLLAMLGAAELPAPSAAALKNASAAILADWDVLPAPASVPARAARGRLEATIAAAVLAAWALPLALARRPVAGGRGLAASFGLAALAAIASAATISLGGVAAVAFPVISAAASLLSGSGSALAAGPGLHCAFIEGLMAFGAAGVAWGASRLLARRAPSVALLSAAMGGGALAGHAALNETCGAATELPHALVFHTGPVALAVALAFVAAGAARRAPAPLT
jgi:hypothetical protein